MIPEKTVSPKKKKKNCFTFRIRCVYNVKILLAAMLLRAFLVWKLLNESNRKTLLVPSAVAHLSAAIIPYHENQFGSPPQTTNTAISVQLLERLSKLDRWIPFPVHWQIGSWPHWLIWSHACTFLCVRPPITDHKPRDFADQKGSPSHPPTFLSVAICPSHNKRNTTSTWHRLVLWQIWSEHSWTSLLKCQPRCVNNTSLTRIDSCASVYSIS